MADIPSEQDQFYMQCALQEAQRALAINEVPIGCVIVHEDRIIGCGYNQRELLQDPTAHAEILAIKEAARHLGSWRLENARLYVTLEPCPMCAGAIILSRIEALYFGAYDPKAGCCGSLMNLPADKRFNHRPQMMGGVLGEACGDLLRSFFRSIREKSKAHKLSYEQ
ncbi:MAG: nucleoside deaminase [Candidatus Hydrogenedentes bacterium]|jgi:tRNA(adenine34) deaminase|nr:nucleoside deaminase [Candidatus Hydrogenedentota bacterium]